MVNLITADHSPTTEKVTPLLNKSDQTLLTTLKQWVGVSQLLQ